VAGGILGASRYGRDVLSAAPKLLNPGLLAFFGYKEYKELREQNYGRTAAAVIAAGHQLPFALIHGFWGGAALMAYQTLSPLASAAYDIVGVKRRTQLVPFAHRWEWSDAASRAMQKVNASASGGYFQGNEAALMAQRYLRE